MGWEADGTPRGNARSVRTRASAAQLKYLREGLSQPGGRLPLFDRDGGRVDPKTVQACIKDGFCEPWFANPMKPDWLVCRLTENGRRLFR